MNDIPAQQPPLAFRDRVGRVMNHHVTEIFVGVLIIIAVVLVVTELSLPSSHPHHSNVVLANDIFTFIFVIELILRFIGERRPARFLRRCWIDILALLPVMRGFRILRVLRLFRLVPVVGSLLSREMKFLSDRFSFMRLEYVLLLLAIFISVLMGALSMRFAEGRSNADFETIGNALWFAFLTLVAGEPIGGDPTTEFGRVVTASLMLIGLTVFAIFTGTVSAVMVDSLKSIKLRTMDIEDLANHTVVCGWNRAGARIVEELLYNRPKKFLVLITETEIADDHEVLRHYQQQIFHVYGDYTRLDVLDKARVRTARAAILLSDDTKEERSPQDRDARTVLAAMLIEKQNSRIHTTVQLHNRDNITSLRNIGVEEVIVSDEYVGNIMATVVRNRGVITVLDELLTSKRGDNFHRSKVPNPLVGMTVADAVRWLKTERDSTLIAIDVCAGKDSIHVNPPADFVIEAEFDLITAGPRPL